jgi:hypothetical protein
VSREAVQWAYENFDPKLWFHDHDTPGLNSSDIDAYLEIDMFHVFIVPKDVHLPEMTVVIKLEPARYLRNLSLDFTELYDAKLKKGFKLTIIIQQTSFNSIQVQKLQNACAQLMAVVTRLEEKGASVELRWTWSSLAFEPHAQPYLADMSINQAMLGATLDEWANFMRTEAFLRNDLLRDYEDVLDIDVVNGPHS